MIREAPARPADAEAVEPRALRVLRSEWLWLALLTATAALLRLYHVGALPPGLYHDEAYYGLDALRVLDGERPLFFPANNGREPLFIYLLALSVHLLGPTPGALRIVSALVGILTVPAAHLLGRVWFGPRVGLLAAWFTAVTVWSLNLSRIAFRAVTLPLLAALALALLWQAWHRRRSGLIVGAGALYGLTLYTYLAARATPLALGLIALYLLALEKKGFWWRGLLLFALTATVVALPLGLALIAGGDGLLRVGQVSILNPEIGGASPWASLLRQLARTAGAFFVRGDFIPRHNVPLRPVFDPPAALVALAGATICAVRARRSAPHGATLIWVGAMLLPTVLAEDAPHFLRGVGVLPVLFLLPALGIDALWRWVQRHREGRVALPVAVVAGIALLAGAGQGLHAYARHVHSEAAYYQFETGATELAARVNGFLGTGWPGDGLAAHGTAGDQGRRAYLAPRLWENWSSVRYLLAPAEGQGLLFNDATTSAGDGDDTLLVLWPYEDPGVALDLLPRDRLILTEQGALERGDLEAESRLLYITVQSAPPPAGMDEPLAAWEQGIALSAYEIHPGEGSEIVVDLYWRAEGPVGFGYSVFVHLLEDGILGAQHDGPAAEGFYGSERWRQGDLVRDRHRLALESPLSGGERTLRVGLYRWDTLDHLRLLDAEGLPTDQTAALLAATADPCSGR